MAKLTEARISKLEQVTGRGRVTYQFVELRQCADAPDLWTSSPDGSDSAPLAEHRARQAEYTILVCLAA